MKQHLLRGLAVAGLLLGGLAFANTASAADVCPPNDSGKKDLPNPNPTSFEVTAPEGKLISGYCIKGGSEQSGGGTFDVVVNPPAKTVTLVMPAASDIRTISHYSLVYVDETSTTTTTTTTSTTTTTTTQPPDVLPVPTPPAAVPPAPEGEVSAAGPVPPAAAPPAAAPPAAAPTALPSTGSSSWGLALAALASLMGGFGLMKLSRRPS